MELQFKLQCGRHRSHPNTCFGKHHAFVSCHFFSESDIRKLVSTRGQKIINIYAEAFPSIVLVCREQNLEHKHFSIREKCCVSEVDTNERLNLRTPVGLD